MKLLYPDFLWALLAVLIPVIIHLFNFKKFKREYFSNINLLKEVKLETQSKSKLKHLLVLFSRIIAISLLVLAFCQPYIATNTAKEVTDNVIGIFVDNSQSMDAKSKNGYLLDLAKLSALEIVNAYSASDEFQLLTNDFEGKHQRIVSQDEALKLIEEISLSPISKSFYEVYEREKDLLKGFKGRKELFWLSDFQKNNLSIGEIKIDSSFKLKLIPFAQEKLSNLYIDSVWFSTPLRQINKDEKLNVRIVNRSNNDVGTKVNLKINNNFKGLLNATINANSTKIVELNYSIQKRGEQLGEVSLSDYPDPNLTFDDKFLFSYSIDEKPKVLLLSNKTAATANNILAVYSNDENHSVESESFSEVDYSKLSNYSLIILANVKEISAGLKNELVSYLSKGGSVFLVPSENLDLTSYDVFFNTILNATILGASKTNIKVGSLNKESLFYEDVFEKTPINIDLPLVTSYYPVQFRTRSQTTILMSLKNGDSFLSVSKVGKGSFYFLASPFSQNTLTQHALFVPTLLKIAENSQLSYPLFYEIGEKGAIVINSSIKEGTVFIKEVNSDFEFIPEVIKNNGANRIAVHEKIKRPNHYELFTASKNRIPLSYNLNRKESDLNYYSVEELTNQIDQNQLNNFVEVIVSPVLDGSTTLGSLIEDQKYWKYFIVGALLFLLIEILLIRFFKS